jgi:hypothetical protein
MGKRARVGATALLVCLLGASSPQPDLTITVFPADNPWNWDISGFAVHPNSDAYINAISSTAPIREDYSFYYSVVDNTQPIVDVPFTLYADESDPGTGFGSPGDGTLSTGRKGRYPIPNGAPIEGGSDAHLLVINRISGLLYETYQTSGGPPWSASCGAVYDLNSNLLRPDGWTSADAAGLPIFPGLIRYDEVFTVGAINHALRFTCQNTQNAHIYPARHDAGSANSNYPPMGLRLRLKASKDISGYTAEAKVILTALKKHGLILADNGSNWYISTTDDSRWGGTNITGIRAMKGSDFEVVTSVDATGAPILPVTSGGTGPPPPPPPSGGTPGTGGCGLTGMEAVLLLALLRPRRSRP